MLFEAKNAIFCIFADFNIHYNVMNSQLRFRNLSVNGTPNFVSMKLNLGLLDRWEHTEQNRESTKGYSR